MFNFTRKTDYALVALARLAEEKEHGGEPLSVRQIAVEFGLPTALLMNLMKELHRAGIVRSKRGAEGGYWLARRPGEVTLAEVVEVLEGPLAETPCGDDSQDPSVRLGKVCPITRSVHRLSSRMVGLLHTVTLEDLMSQPDGGPLVLSGSAGRAGV